MQPLLETIDLDLEESNELRFTVKIEGIEPAPAKVRLVCEAQDVAYMFNGRSTSDPDVVEFVMPVMKDRLKEGTYLGRVEVMIENRYFAPVQFNIHFKKTVKVVAENVQVVVRKPEPTVSVTAAPVVVRRPVPTPPAPKPAIEERPVLTLRERYVLKRGR